MSVSANAKVFNTGNFNLALNLIPRQVRPQRKCPNVSETPQVRSASPPPSPPTPPPVQNNPEPAQTQEVVPVNPGEVELQPRPYQVGSLLLSYHVLSSFSSLTGGAPGEGQDEEHHRVPGDWQRQDLHRCHVDQTPA